nr:immunoglobulin heavy chain junction region [Macaca mulatta]MOV47533.1 immunoglobulin heavy chain junction region [Macaca mulatta]MOV47538.1 immunoglobulin heavy chain junction region [Macaca mulatta]MOV47607.1 immunoglobulin heavy chain junction region [Macaca mulatta]MOV47608.1 immunoglobulin heavy chain junction region [Macaca mulatta]
CARDGISSTYEEHW